MPSKNQPTRYYAWLALIYTAIALAILRDPRGAVVWISAAVAVLLVSWLYVRLTERL